MKFLNGVVEDVLDYLICLYKDIVCFFIMYFLKVVTTLFSGTAGKEATCRGGQEEGRGKTEGRATI